VGRRRRSLCRRLCPVSSERDSRLFFGCSQPHAVLLWDEAERDCILWM